MNNISIAFNAVAPLLLMLMTGYLLRLFHVADEVAFSKLNELNFKFFFPMHLFRNMYSCDIYAVEISPLIYSLVGLIAIFIILRVIVPKIETRPERIPVIVQGIFRGNTAVYGMPLAITILGAENTGTILVGIAFFGPLLNILSVITLSTQGESQIDIRTLLKRIVTNPFIIGIFSGLILNFLKIEIGDFLFGTIGKIADGATPMSFVALGGLFSFGSIAKNRKTLLAVCAAKLIIIPMVIIIPAILIGFRGASVIALLAMFATPTAIASFTMTKSIGGDADLAGEIVVTTTAFSMLTIFIWITILLSLNVIP